MRDTCESEEWYAQQNKFLIGEVRSTIKKISKQKQLLLKEAAHRHQIANKWHSWAQENKQCPQAPMNISPYISNTSHNKSIVDLMLSRAPS